MVFLTDPDPFFDRDEIVELSVVGNGFVHFNRFIFIFHEVDLNV